MEEAAAAIAPCGAADEVAPLTYYRLLDPEADEWLYRDCYKWIEGYPAWLRDADETIPTLEKMLKEARSGKQLDLGCWHAGEFVAVASFSETFVGGLEMTVWASRQARARYLAPGIWEIGNSLFEDGVKEIYCVLARFHKENRKLAEACWMEFDGSRRLKLTPKGRIVEWMRYAITWNMWQRRRNEKQTDN